MRVRDSGMPDEEYWESLFDVPLTLERFAIDQYHDVVELGCGYGTFSIPIARTIRGTLTTFDIDPAMVERTRQRAGGLPIVCLERDVLVSGFGITADAVLLFNILHCEKPLALLSQAADAASDILVTHWRHGDTPRGPALDIRPRPEQVIAWGSQLGLEAGEVLDLPPWHYGVRLRRLSRDIRTA